MRISDWSSDVCSSDLFDHRTGMLANPTILLDKRTTDAHDNPVLSIDGKGYIWIFSTSHGASRPSYIRSEERRVGTECAVRVDLGGRSHIQKTHQTIIHI